MTRPRREPVSRGWLRLVAWLLAAPTGALAHHSISGVYDGSRQVTIEGHVVEFQFVNPHPFLIVATESDAKSSRTWRLEMDNRYE
ncbi:MAG TPA: DUF6152 family protein, partial [Gammaproteobacteria bacterium]|nr:DUF6152 family protein [Gammaproteobacteria bacterium]